MRTWLYVNDGAFGLGIKNLLLSIDKIGNIKLAAGEIGMSYSKAYSLLNHFENDSGCRLIDRHHGRTSGNNATLTKTAKDLIAKYDVMTAKTQEFMQNEVEMTFADFEAKDHAEKKPRRR